GLRPRRLSPALGQAWRRGPPRGEYRRGAQRRGKLVVEVVVIRPRYPYRDGFQLPASTRGRAVPALAMLLWWLLAACTPGAATTRGAPQTGPAANQPAAQASTVPPAGERPEAPAPLRMTVNWSAISGVQAVLWVPYETGI